jgi:predicted lipoprotein with Yx(FWY)xxD motif
VTLAKPIIVDTAGRTVYMYLPDGASKTSRVPPALKQVWPAVLAPGAAIVGSGLSASKLAVDMQAGGAHQVAYNGHLLYTFAQDTAPGDAKGQGLGGIWFALSPAGTKIS